MPKLLDRTGEVNINRCGSTMEIVGYKNKGNILVKINDPEVTVQTTYHSFKNGTIKHPYVRSIYGIGFLGEGKHKYGEGSEMSHKYKTWHGMMRRCYDGKFKGRKTTYKDCSVAEEWHNYQNFGNWYDENFYEVEGELMSLDKDILVNGNKIYSPETCVFVPQKINSAFVKHHSSKAEILPCVYYYKSDKETSRYTARTRTVHIGNFDTPERAFEAYKRYKKIIIRDVANEYRGKIPNNLYETMINYKVENLFI